MTLANEIPLSHIRYLTITSEDGLIWPTYSAPEKAFSAEHYLGKLVVLNHKEFNVIVGLVISDDGECFRVFWTTPWLGEVHRITKGARSFYLSSLWRII